MLTSDSDIASMMLIKHLRTHWNDLDVGTRTRLAAGALIPAAVYHRAMRARVSACVSHAQSRFRSKR